MKTSETHHRSTAARPEETHLVTPIAPVAAAQMGPEFTPPEYLKALLDTAKDGGSKITPVTLKLHEALESLREESHVPEAVANEISECIAAGARLQQAVQLDGETIPLKYAQRVNSMPQHAEALTAITNAAITAMPRGKQR